MINFALLDFKICYKFLIGFRSGDWGCQISIGTSFSTRNSETSPGAYKSQIIFLSTLTKGLIPPEMKKPQNLTDASLSDFRLTGRFLAGMQEWSLWNNFVYFGFDRIIVSWLQTILSQNSGPFRYNFLQFRILIVFYY